MQQTLHSARRELCGATTATTARGARIAGPGGRTFTMGPT